MIYYNHKIDKFSSHIKLVLMSNLLLVELELNFQRCSFLVSKREWEFISKHIAYHKQVKDENLYYSYRQSIYGDIVVYYNPDIAEFRAQKDYEKETDSVTVWDEESSYYAKRKDLFDVSEALKTILPNVICNGSVCNPEILMNIFNAIFENDITTLNNLMKYYDDSAYDWSKSKFNGILGYAIVMGYRFDSDVVQTLLNHNVRLDYCFEYSNLLWKSLLYNDVRLFEYILNRHPELLEKEKCTVFKLIEISDVSSELVKRVLKMVSKETLKVTRNYYETLLFTSIPTPHFETVLETYIAHGFDFDKDFKTYGVSLLDELKTKVDMLVLMKYFPSVNTIIS